MPNQSDHLDLIDSCYSNSVSGNSTYFDSLCSKGFFNPKKIILSNSMGVRYKIESINSTLTAVELITSSETLKETDDLLFKLFSNLQPLTSVGDGSFSKETSVTFDSTLWAATNGTIKWSDYPAQIPYSEQDVYHVQLSHNTDAINDIDWSLRIGKGGQLYYANLEGLGQIICPQRSFSPWNDDCMTTTVYSADVANTDTEMGGNDSFANGYIHGSGMYIKPHMDALSNKPFYCPILAEKFDLVDRSYSIINWGLVPKPSINRGDVVFYSKYRDLGNGVLELTFYFYNFGDRIYNFAETPWWAVRPSKFPFMLEGINGTSSFKINGKRFQDGAIASTGGWGAHTVNPNNPDSITCALVWGSESRNLAVNFGLVNNGERDMSLIAPSYNGLNLGFGKGFYYKRYAVFGKLKDVRLKCAELNTETKLDYIEFSETYSGKMPLYETKSDGQYVLTSKKPTNTSTPIAATFPIPVKDSYPLIMMRNLDNGNYFITTDLYAACGKIPFINPYSPSNPKYPTYQNRTIYQPYDEKTEWVSLLGYVTTANPSDIGNGYELISTLLPKVSFISGEKLSSNQLMIQTI